ncbi:MAG TPA: cellulose synthase subunit BcsC-related outer membrane protein [Gallionella sp.]
MYKKISLFALCVTLGTIQNHSFAAPSAEETQQSASLAALAQTQVNRKQFKDAETNYRKALSIDPLNVNAIRELIKLLRKQGQASRVQLAIAQLSTEQREAMGPSIKRIEATMLQDQADLRFAKGQTDDGIKYLERAIEVDTDDPWLHYKLASQYAGRNQLTKGRELLEGHLARHPNDTDTLYALTLYLSAHDNNGDALKYLNRIPSDKRTPEMTTLHQRLMTRNLVPAAKSLALEGKKDEAEKLLSDAEASSRGNREQTLAIAFAWAEIGEVSRGRALFSTVDTSHDDFDELGSDARSGLIKILIASDKRNLALQLLDKWTADPSAMDIPVGLHLSNLNADIGEYARAKRLIDRLLAANPKQSYMLYDAWKIAERTGHLDDEIDYLKKLVIAEPADTRSARQHANRYSSLPYGLVGIDEFGSADKIERDWKERKLAALIDRRSRWISSAIDLRSRTGTPGVSEYHSVEIPLEYKTPWHPDDEVFFRTDLVRLSAGSVEAANGDFGSMLLCRTNCTAATLDQSAQGMSFTAGYQRTDFSLDIGTTPRSFHVSNVVGGMHYKGDLGPFGYSLEASRRPVTASLLSYSGTRDPNTGEVWGGVVATGGNFGLSLDSGETFGFWSSLGVHNLTGRNVLTNRRFQFLAGEQWRIVNEENRRIVIGLTGMYWDFSENAGEYTFGHGGYYSPHNYRSLSLPITYAARTARFSYMLRGSVSASHSQTREAPYYPTDSAMQAQALAFTSAPTYSASSGGGQGHSLRAAWEYQVTPELFAGGLFAIERSDYYAPNRALLYLRYSLDHPGARPVFLPPEPVEPSSQFY